MKSVQSTFPSASTVVQELRATEPTYWNTRPLSDPSSTNTVSPVVTVLAELRATVVVWSTAVPSPSSKPTRFLAMATPTETAPPPRPTPSANEALMMVARMPELARALTLTVPVLVTVLLSMCARVREVTTLVARAPAPLTPRATTPAETAADAAIERASMVGVERR